MGGDWRGLLLKCGRLPKRRRCITRRNRLFWRRKNRPSPPPVEQEEEFVEWLLRHGKEFGVHRKIYGRDIGKYVRINKKSVLEELQKYPNKVTLRDRLGYLSTFYMREFMPAVEERGGIFFLDPQAQAHVAMLQIKLQAFNYILKYKYRDEVTSMMETVCGPLEDLNFE